MTDYTATTITNNISSAGPTPATLFDAATSLWDVAKWDDKTLDMVTNVQKLITESEGSTSALTNFAVSKLLTESEASTSTIINSPFKLLTESEVVTATASGEYLFDGTLVWNYDFPAFTPNFESMSTASFTAAINNSTSWSTVVTNTVGWS